MKESDGYRRVRDVLNRMFPRGQNYRVSYRTIFSVLGVPDEHIPHFRPQVTRILRELDFRKISVRTEKGVEWGWARDEKPSVTDKET